MVLLRFLMCFARVIGFMGNLKLPLSSQVFPGKINALFNQADCHRVPAAAFLVTILMLLSRVLSFQVVSLWLLGWLL